MLRSALRFVERFRLDLVEPNDSRSVPDYHQAFEACARFSRTFAPDTPNLALSRATTGPERRREQIAAALRDGSGQSDAMAHAAGQCLKFSHYFAPFLEQQTGRRAWPTLGQLWKGDHRVYGPASWSDLRSLLDRGIQLEDLTREGLNGLQLHAWITLEKGELVDLTFASTLALALPDGLGELRGAIVWGREPDVLVGHRYFPMLAGAPAFERLNAKSCLPFLANSVGELPVVFGLSLTPSIGIGDEARPER